MTSKSIKFDRFELNATSGASSTEQVEYSQPGLDVSHVPNLICELNESEVRHLNQLNSADFN